MKKLILMIAVVMMAFTASFAQDRQHNDQTARDQATHVRDAHVTTNSYQGSHRYRSQSRVHHMRTRRHHRNYDHQ